MNPPRRSGAARRLLPLSTALTLAAISAGCDPAYTQITVAAAPSVSTPGANGRVIVRDAWPRGLPPTAQIIVSGGSVVAPLEGVELTCEPREICSTREDMVEIRGPIPGVNHVEVTIAKAGFAPEHLKLEVAVARQLHFQQFFVMLKPTTDGVTR